jgi:hypothetical protein
MELLEVGGIMLNRVRLKIGKFYVEFFADGNCWIGLIGGEGMMVGEHELEWVLDRFYKEKF